MIYGDCRSRTPIGYEGYINNLLKNMGFTVQKSDKKYFPDYTAVVGRQCIFVECKQVSAFPKVDGEYKYGILLKNINKWLIRYFKKGTRQAKKILYLCKNQHMVYFAFHCKKSNLSIIVPLNSKGEPEWKS